MKVKITKTIDFDQIPDEVREMVRCAIHQLEECKSKSSELLVGDLGLKSLTNVSELSAELSEISQSFTEMQNILSGYLVNGLFPQEEQKQEQPTEKTDVKS